MEDRAPLHGGAWISWLAAILAVTSLTRNPIYLLLVLLWIGLVTLALNLAALPGEPLAFPLSPLRFGLFVVVVAAFFNALTVHVGSTVLFTMPRAIPLLGGPVTLEAMIYGLLNGLVIAGLFAAFILLNRAVAIRDLVRLIPRAYYPVAVVVSIAVTFVPTTLRQFQAIREAQAVRGHRMRGLGSWLPLFIPLLTGGLEQALQLSEAMMARGFAGTGPADPAGLDESWLRVGLIGGLAAVISGWLLRLVWGKPVWGMALLVGGTLLVVFVLWRTGKRHPHTVYRPQPWRWRDWIVTGMALASALIFVAPWPGIDRISLFYTPYLTLSMPSFSLLYGVATWGLLAPAVVLAWDKAQREMAARRASFAVADGRSGRGEPG